MESITTVANDNMELLEMPKKNRQVSAQER